MSENLSIEDHVNGGRSWLDQTAERPCVLLPEPATSEATLRDGVKALNCLWSIDQAAEGDHADLASLLGEVVCLLPSAWQYPEVCRARLVLDDQEHHSPAFRASSWKQTADVVVLGQKRGVIEIYYVQRMPNGDEGPFLKEERGLLNLVAERVARLVERDQVDRRLHSTIKELKAECAALQQSNTALHGALERVTTEKQAVQEAIVTNVDNVLIPLLCALDRELPREQRKYVTLLKDNLTEITSPFADKLSRAFMSLTAVEIRICQMIRDGLTTKQIAGRREVSPATVARQRERIRHKLALTGTDANLATYLRTFLVERP